MNTGRPAPSIRRRNCRATVSGHPVAAASRHRDVSAEADQDTHPRLVGDRGGAVRAERFGGRTEVQLDTGGHAHRRPGPVHFNGLPARHTPAP